jgi:hypothetical protein
MRDIDRWNWRYWIDGAGAWMARWHCTGHDALLLAVLSFGVFWMVGEYFYYAYLLKQSRGLFYDESFRIHLQRLMRVFILCGIIHLTNVLIWFWTPYLLWAVMFYINAALSNRLNNSFNKAIRAKHLSETISQSRLRDIGDRLDRLEHVYLGDIEPNPKTLRELAEDLRKMVG